MVVGRSRRGPRHRQPGLFHSQYTIPYEIGEVMKKCYAVSEGEYSDYRVLAVFEDQDSANRHAEEEGQSPNRLWGREPYVDEFWFFPSGSDPKRIYRFTATVELRDDFSAGEVVYKETFFWDYDQVPSFSRPRVHYARNLRGDPIDQRTPVNSESWNDLPSGTLTVTGDSERAVAKVMGERIAAFKSRSWNPSNKEHNQ